MCTIIVLSFRGRLWIIKRISNCETRASLLAVRITAGASLLAVRITAGACVKAPYRCAWSQGHYSRVVMLWAAKVLIENVSNPMKNRGYSFVLGVEIHTHERYLVCLISVYRIYFSLVGSIQVYVEITIVTAKCANHLGSMTCKATELSGSISDRMENSVPETRVWSLDWMPLDIV